MTAHDETLPYGPLRMYRGACARMLRRYFNMSVELGRLPSVLGRELFFVTRHTCPASSFEDHVIFVHDVERALMELSEFDQQLVSRVLLQEHSQEEAARLLGCGLRTLERRLPEMLDELSEILLRRGLLRALPNVAEDSYDEADSYKEEKNLANRISELSIHASVMPSYGSVENSCQERREGWFNANV